MLNKDTKHDLTVALWFLNAVVKQGKKDLQSNTITLNDLLEQIKNEADSLSNKCQWLIDNPE